MDISELAAEWLLTQLRTGSAENDPHREHAPQAAEADCSSHGPGSFGASEEDAA